MAEADHQLALSIGLTAKTQQLCLGLESGAADILELVTPTTADLLMWWFGEDMVMARGALNFHAGQKQAILNAIVAHEVLGKDHTHWSLLDLYKAAAPDGLLVGTRLNEVAQAKHAHPKYCLKMATGTGKTWVLQALLIWQMLNKTAALAEGLDDARFTRQFMVVAPGLIVYERLLDAFCGKLLHGGNGSRDFATSDMAQFADLFIPEAHREAVFAFVRGNVCAKSEIGLKATGNGMIDAFISQDLQSATLFGDYRVDGAVMNVCGYNDYLSRLTRRISQALSSDLPTGNKVATHLAKPYLQVNTAELTGWIDDYIWTQLFDAAFNPLDEENWRVLLLQPVVNHITKVFALALMNSEHKHVTGQTEVHHRMLSEVPKLMLRESHSAQVSKCVYTRLGWPAHSGGLERAFIHWAQADTQVQALCKISENRHTFARLRYVKDDGLSAFYSPDFLVRTQGVTNQAIYLVETKAEQQTIHPNVQRKRKAALAWCERINALPPTLRGELPWHYVLLGEVVFDEWQRRGARLAELLDYARLRPLADASRQTLLL